MIPSIHINDYHYRLPDAQIPRFPPDQRDRSKLLTFSGNAIGEHVFSELPGLLPQNALLVFNETKVIPARLIFRKDSGAFIELFCLEPLEPGGYERAMAAKTGCLWRCIVGNAKRWKGETLSCPIGAHTLYAKWVEKGEEYVVRFSWDAPLSFAEVLDRCGRMPIPPYLKREATVEDNERYQTVYAHHPGSVAAPTAGLHFTEQVLDNIAARHIAMETITLHVGAGTFRPVKSETLAEHTMHAEPFFVTQQTLQALLQHPDAVIAVGTTSARTLESLYFLGRQCLLRHQPQSVTQWEAFDALPDIPVTEALQALLDYMQSHRIDSLGATTQLLIAPPYPFRLVRGLVTNFHQPKSTLLVLVGAFIGKHWREVYDYALSHHFRFLSYGDSSLLMRVDG